MWIGDKRALLPNQTSGQEMGPKPECARKAGGFCHLIPELKPFTLMPNAALLQRLFCNSPFATFRDTSHRFQWCLNHQSPCVATSGTRGASIVPAQSVRCVGKRPMPFKR